MSGWSPEQWIIFFGGLAVLLTQIANLLTSLRNGSRTATAIKEIRDNTAATEEIRVHTNGMSTQLNAATMLVGIAEGRAQGAAEAVTAETNKEAGRVEGRAENVKP